MKCCRWIALAILVFSTVGAHAQRANWKDQYDAQEYMIPARDGTKLKTVVYVPKDKPGPFPILLERTPYGAGSASRPPQRSTAKITEAGYILAWQDVRGTGGSEGDFVNVRPTLQKGEKGVDEAMDTWDTVDYLVKNVPKNNGNIGMWGISYPGFYAGAGAIHTHPALKAVSPQAPVNDWFLGDDVHHNGVLFVQESFDFSVGFDVPRGAPRISVDREGLNAYDFYLKAGALSNYETKFIKGGMPYWQELMDNTTYNEYWKSRALWRSFKDVHCAVLTVGGLFDKEDMYGALTLYKASEKQNKGIPNFLVMGPWSHGQWASGNGSSLNEISFGSRTGQWYQENIEFPFFERYLRNNTGVRPVAEATIFETGANEWRSFSAWPPKDMKRKEFYLGPDGTLTDKKPTQTGGASYIADPVKPTPYVADFESSRRAPGDWLIRDQRMFGTRKDVVSFTMPALADDLRVAGPVDADIWITTTGSDADLVVKLIDEIPADSSEQSASGGSLAGYQMMVRGDIMRAKFRNSFERPMPILPGTPTRVKFTMNDVLHTFKKGHRIIVQVQSYWFPIADRNPNVFLDINKATDADFKSATINILYGGNTASALRVGSPTK